MSSLVTATAEMNPLPTNKTKLLRFYSFKFFVINQLIFIVIGADLSNEWRLSNKYDQKYKVPKSNNNIG